MTKDCIKSVISATNLQAVKDDQDEIEMAVKDQTCRMHELQDGKYMLLDLIHQMQESVNSKMLEVHENENIFKGESELEKIEREMLKEIWDKHQMLDSDSQCFLDMEEIQVWRLSLERMLLEDTKRIQNNYSELEKMESKYLDDINDIQSIQQLKIQEMGDKYYKYQMRIRFILGKEKHNDCPESKLILVESLDYPKIHGILPVVSLERQESQESQQVRQVRSGLVRQASNDDKWMHDCCKRDWVEAKSVNRALDSDAKKESAQHSEHCSKGSKDDQEHAEMFNTLDHNTSKLQESHQNNNKMSEEMEKIRDRLDLAILEMKTKLRMLQNKQNMLDMTKWQSGLQDMKTELLKGREQRTNMKSEVLQDTIKTKDRIESSILMMKCKVSKLRKMKGSAQMNRWKDTFEEAKELIYELLQKRNEIKIKLNDKIPSMQKNVTSIMQEMKSLVISQLQKILALDMDLVHQAKSNGMCPSDMNTEKWKLGLEELEKELLEHIRVNQLTIQSELQAAQNLLGARRWQEVEECKTEIETMQQMHLSEKQKLEEKYSELVLLEKSQFEEMERILQEAQSRHFQNDHIERDSASEEKEKDFLKEICQMQERQGNMKESTVVLRKICEPVDLRMQELQERLQSRQANSVHKRPLAIENSEKVLLHEIWTAREDIESEMKNCFEVNEVQDWLSELLKINLE